MGTQKEKWSTSLKDLFQNIKNKREHIYGCTYSEATIGLKQMYLTEDSFECLCWPIIILLEWPVHLSLYTFRLKWLTVTSGLYRPDNQILSV